MYLGGGDDSEAGTPAQRQHRHLDSLMPMTSAVASLCVEAEGLTLFGRWRVTVPRACLILHPSQSIDPNSQRSLHLFITCRSIAQFRCNYAKTAEQAELVIRAGNSSASSYHRYHVLITFVPSVNDLEAACIAVECIKKLEILVSNSI